MMVLCVLVAMPVAAEVGPISIGVSPPRFEVELAERSASDSLRVFNFGEEPAEVEVSVQNWTLNADNQLELLPPDEQSLASWMIINPLRFTIPPGEAQTVRFSIRPRIEPADGEHRAIIFLKQTPPAPSNASMLRIVGRVGVAVYAYSGPERSSSALHELSVDTLGDAPVFSFDISSMGNRHVRLDGQYTIWSASEYPGLNPDGGEGNASLIKAVEEASGGVIASGELPGTPVLPDTRRQLILALQETLPPGEYVFEADGKLGDQPLRQAITFIVDTASVAQGAAD